MGAHHRARGGKFKIWSLMGLMGPHTGPMGPMGSPWGPMGPIWGPMGPMGLQILNCSPPRAVVRTHYSDPPIFVFDNLKPSWGELPPKFWESVAS